MGQTWIKLYRKLQHSQMYKSLNSKQRDIMIQLLLMANYSENEWMWNGELQHCSPGQFVTSLDSIKDYCAKDVSIQNIRTALKKLKTWRFLADESTKQGRKITIINWETYQCSAEELTNESTKDQQRTNKQLTANKKERKKEYKKNTSSGDEGEVYFSKKKRKLTGKQLETFNLFWECFAYRNGKADAADSWLDIPNLTDSLVNQICEAAKKEAVARLQSDKSPKWAQGWLSGRRWEDEDLSATPKKPENQYQPKILTAEDIDKRNQDIGYIPGVTDAAR